MLGAGRIAGDDGREAQDAGSVHVNGGRIWLVFTDLLANRVFFECGIVDRAKAAFPNRLTALFLVHEKHVRPWRERLHGIEVLQGEDVMPTHVLRRERVARRVDFELDKRIGFYPLALRHSLRHGFHRDRLAAGHVFPFLDLSRTGPLPRWRWLESLMTRWHLSSRRHVPAALLERMQDDCRAVVLTNPQAHSSMPLLSAARRLDLPTIGYIASWDHPVGKGIVSPHLDRYIVQNVAMCDDLVRYHGIEPSRVVVTGWPQTDVYHRRQSRDSYRSLLRGLGLADHLPVVLYAGNAPHNAPFEANLVTRLVSWWRGSGANRRFGLLFRPHPHDREVATRYQAVIDEPGAALQRPSFAGLEELALLLQHVDAVVANAGTILLDALVNDRPSVCVTFDEGAPEGQRWADLNLAGAHYRDMVESGAFYRAADFDELVLALDRALADPGELRAQRVRLPAEVVGEVDGRAAERVVSAIQGVVRSETAATAGVIREHAWSPGSATRGLGSIES